MKGLAWAFHKGMASAVRVFQSDKRLVRDGMIGPKTSEKIKNAKPNDKLPPAPKPKPPAPKPDPQPKPAPKGDPEHISKRGLDLIAEFEGFVAKCYDDPTGNATIGYGHLIHIGRVTERDKKQWGALSEPEGLFLLKKDVIRYERAVKESVKVRLTQNQFDALVSFTYNLGAGALSTSTLLKKLNTKDYKGAAAEFDRWVMGSGQRLPGLVRRRDAEQKLFLTK